MKVDIPVLPTVSARVTFHDFAWKNVRQPEARAKSSKETQENSSMNETTVEDIDMHKQGSNIVSENVADETTMEKINAESSDDKSSEADVDNLSEKSNKDDVELDDSLFQVPPGYVEDNTRFPDL